jgi:hypothetical protein
MAAIEEIIQSKIKPAEKLTRLVELVTSKAISGHAFMDYFRQAPYSAKGTCADAMKHISLKNPEILAPCIDLLESAKIVIFTTFSFPFSPSSSFSHQGRRKEKGNPELLFRHSLLVAYINHPAPRVKWGVPETIGNLVKSQPEAAAKAIPYLLKNVSPEKQNTTVIRWCSAFALGEIVKFNPETRAQLVQVFNDLIKGEENNGVRNVFFKAQKFIEKGQ